MSGPTRIRGRARPTFKVTLHSGRKWEELQFRQTFCLGLGMTTVTRLVGDSLMFSITLPLIRYTNFNALLSE
jgi:hypothetical protein